ncbi:MAG: hypothetical protein QW830_05780 [Nitrososphaerales archaeon]
MVNEAHTLGGIKCVKTKDNGGEKDEDLIRKFTEFKGDYLSIEKDRLVLFTIDYLHSKNIEVTFDKLTVAAFKLFPKKFSLVGFPEYPDAKTTDSCVTLHCVKTKGWVSGNAQTGYTVTEKGKYFLDETKKMLEGKIKVTRKYGTTPRRKELTFINLLKKTKAYKSYSQRKYEELSDSDILEALKVPVLGSSEKVERYIQRYMEYALRINDMSAVEFLKFAKRKLKGG